MKNETEYLCKIDTSNWMRSHEDAYISVTSPTGKTIDIKKNRYSEMTNDQRTIFCKISDCVEIFLSINEMQQLVNIK